MHIWSSGGCGVEPISRDPRQRTNDWRVLRDWPQLGGYACAVPACICASSSDQRAIATRSHGHDCVCRGGHAGRGTDLPGRNPVPGQHVHSGHPGQRRGGASIERTVRHRLGERWSGRVVIRRIRAAVQQLWGKGGHRVPSQRHDTRSAALRRGRVRCRRRLFRRLGRRVSLWSGRAVRCDHRGAVREQRQQGRRRLRRSRSRAGRW